MKWVGIFLIIIALSSPLQAERLLSPTCGKASRVGVRQASNCCSSWLIGLGVVGVVAIVVGVVAGSSTKDPSFAH